MHTHEPAIECYPTFCNRCSFFCYPLCEYIPQQDGYCFSTVKHIVVYAYQRCTCLWRVYIQFYGALQREISVNRKKLSGVTKQLHSLYRSQLLEKWKDCSSDADIRVEGKDRKAAIVYARAVCTELIKRRAGNKRENYFNDSIISLRQSQSTPPQRKHGAT